MASMPFSLSSSAASGPWPTITCAFVPDMPNALNPARRGPAPRGPSPRGHGTAAAGSTKRVSSIARCGFARSKCKFPGTTPRRRDPITLSSPTNPAAASRCPTLPFTAPSTHDPSPLPYTASMAANSMGSPNAVPVPCVSTYPMPSAATPASLNAARNNACCATTFGAVSPVERPSWLIALPSTTAAMASPLACASSSRRSTTATAPSARTKPSAPASNGRHRPLGDNAPLCNNNRVASASVMTLTPPTTATSHSPRRRLATARCNATSEEEHAVSTARHGPRNPNV